MKGVVTKMTNLGCMICKTTSKIKRYIVIIKKVNINIEEIVLNKYEQKWLHLKNFVRWILVIIRILIRSIIIRLLSIFMNCVVSSVSDLPREWVVWVAKIDMVRQDLFYLFSCLFNLPFFGVFRTFFKICNISYTNNT